jgi:tetratricopeptide (TPR) repeat protein
VLSPAGIGRELVHAAAVAGLPGRDGPLPPLAEEAADAVLARLAGASLLTFSVDGTVVTAHRVVMRVIRDSLAAARALAGVWILGPDHPDTLVSRNNLAAAYRAAGRIGEAITLHEQTLDTFERVLGPEHPDTLTSRDNLGLAYWAAGRIGEAITLHEQVLAARERVLGLEHPDTLRSRSNLTGARQAADSANEA